MSPRDTRAENALLFRAGLGKASAPAVSLAGFADGIHGRNSIVQERGLLDCKLWEVYFLDSNIRK
jgi:hypothetical protein